MKEIRSGISRSIIENAIAVPEHPVIADTEKEMTDMYAALPEQHGIVSASSADTEAGSRKKIY